MKVTVTGRTATGSPLPEGSVLLTAQVGDARAPHVVNPRPSHMVLRAVEGVTVVRVLPGQGQAAFPQGTILSLTLQTDGSRDVDGDLVRCTLEPESPTLLDRDQPGWVGALACGEAQLGIEGIVLPVDRHATVEDIRVDDGRVVIAVRTNARPAPVEVPKVVAFTRIGMLHRWKFVL